MTLDVAEALTHNKPNLDTTLDVAEALTHNKPNLDTTLDVAEALTQWTPYVSQRKITNRFGRIW